MTKNMAKLLTVIMFCLAMVVCIHSVYAESWYEGYGGSYYYTDASGEGMAYAGQELYQIGGTAEYNIQSQVESYTTSGTLLWTNGESESWSESTVYSENVAYSNSDSNSGQTLAVTYTYNYADMNAAVEGAGINMGVTQAESNSQAEIGNNIIGASTYINTDNLAISGSNGVASVYNNSESGSYSEVGADYVAGEVMLNFNGVSESEGNAYSELNSNMSAVINSYQQ